MGYVQKVSILRFSWRILFPSCWLHWPFTTRLVQAHYGKNWLRNNMLREQRHSCLLPSAKYAMSSAISFGRENLRLIFMKWKLYMVKKLWIVQVVPPKDQYQQWRHTSSPSVIKFKTTISAKKIIAPVFWIRRGIVLIEYLPQGRSSTLRKNCETLKKLRMVIWKKTRCMLMEGGQPAPRPTYQRHETTASLI